MKLKTNFTLRLLAVAVATGGSLLCATAQQAVARKAYPQPKVTPRVLEARAAMCPFMAQGTAALPVAIDNSTSKYFPPILDQQGGSCAQASSIGYVFTYEVNRLIDRDAKASASNRFAYMFSWNMLNDGIDQGGFAEQGFYLAQRYGMMTEADYGISSTYNFMWPTGYEKYHNAMCYRVSEILSFSDDDLDAVKRYLFDAGNGSSHGGIVTFSTQSRGWTINNDYSGPSATGYHSLLTSLATSGAHAMTIVGYDDLVSYADASGAVHTGAFIVANSWGTYSHDNGRFYLPYDFFRDKNRSSLSLSHTLQGVRVTTYTPQVVFKIQLSYSSRDDLSFSVAFNASGNTSYASQYHYSQAFYNAGGDWPMRGQYINNPNTIEIAIDATQVISQASPSDEVFFLNIKKSAIGKTLGTGQVLGVSLIDYRSGSPVERPCTLIRFPAEIKPGDNVFCIAPGKPASVKTSASSQKYINEAGNATASTFVVRTASGKLAKLRFANLNTDSANMVLRYHINDNTK